MLDVEALSSAWSLSGVAGEGEGGKGLDTEIDINSLCCIQFFFFFLNYLSF
jgi:hypothetical protein